MFPTQMSSVLYRVVHHEQHGLLGGVEEPGQPRVAHPIAVGDVDQLVVGRHAVLLDIEGAPGPPDDVHLVQLEVAVGTDHRIDLAGDQRRRQREVHVDQLRSEEHTSELQSLMRISYAVFCLKKKKKEKHTIDTS